MSEETVSPPPDEPTKASIPSSEGGTPEAEAFAPLAETPLNGAALPSAEPSIEPPVVAPVSAAAATKIEGDISMRRSPWKSSLAAIAYVQQAAKTDHVQIRTSDRVTIIALLFFCIAEVLSLCYPPLHGFRFPIMCCCDFILGTCIVLFLIYRVGILSALNTRQALICWQLMMGCIFLGIFLCLNAIFGIACLVEAIFPRPML